MPSEKVMDKAQRLIEEGRVHVVAANRVFVVQGDSMVYLCTVLDEAERLVAARLGASPGSCTCEARGVCSHLIAADGLRRAAE